MQTNPKDSARAHHYKITAMHMWISKTNQLNKETSQKNAFNGSVIPGQAAAQSEEWRDCNQPVIYIE